MEAPSRVQVTGRSDCHATRKNTILGVVWHTQLAWALTLNSLNIYQTQDVSLDSKCMEKPLNQIISDL